jgi:RNA polymerase sigma factor (sigma-70 family)
MPGSASEGQDDSPGWEAEFLESMRPGVRRYVRRFLQNKQDIEDAVQEAYAKLLGQSSPDAIRHPFEYLKGIARNVSLAIRRAEINSSKAIQRLDAERELTHDAPVRPDEHNESTERQRDLMRALACLPRKHQHYLYFHVGQDMSREDAAKAAGLTLAAAEKAHARAMGKLACRLRQRKPLDPRNGGKR